MTNDASDGGSDDSPASSGPGAADADAHTLDSLFGAMADRRSRCVASCLESASVDVMELDDLVGHVVERECEAGLADDPEEHHRHVAVALHHKQLPKLAEAAVVDYDERSKTVRYWGGDRLESFLDLFEDEERP